MKRKVVFYLFMGIALFTLTGCNKGLDNSSTNSDIKVINSKDNANDNKKDNDKGSDIKIEKSDVESQESIEMIAGNTIKKDGKYAISYVKSGFSKVVNPPNMSGYYNYYVAEQDGHKYLYIIINYKNLQEYAVRSDEVGTLTVKYADKYDYSGFPVIVDSDGDFTYANITDINPLTTGKMYYLVDLPETVVNGKEPIVAMYTTNSDSYKIKIR